MAAGSAENDPQKDGRAKLRSYLRHSSAGMSIAIAGGLGALLGWWVDKKTGLTPLFLILSVFAGFTLGIYTLYKELFGRRR